MNDDRTLERAARSWLDAGPTEAPDHAVEAALHRIQTTQQERDVRVPWRVRSMYTPARLAVAAIAIAVVAVGGAFILRPGNSPVVGTPSTSGRPSTSATPSLTSVGSFPARTIPPLPTATPRIAGTTALLENMAMQPNVTYSTLRFLPALTLQGAAGFTLGLEHPDSLWFALDANASPYDPTPQVEIVVPSGVMGGRFPDATVQPLPTDLIAWLRAREDMTVGPAHAITIGGAHGSYVDGQLKADAGVDRFGYEDVICVASSPDCETYRYAVGMGLDRPFRVIVLDVHGQTVVIGLNTAGPAADFSVFDGLLNGLAWQPSP